MLKEIYEQPQTTRNALRGRLNFETYKVQLGGIRDRIQCIRRARRLVMIACGTSLHACMAVRAVTEELTQVPVTMENASDFLDRRPPVFRDDVVIFVSQSGETADTLRCLEYCKESEAVLVGFTNTVGSSIARATQCGAYLHCGPEIGVASTKAFTSQIVCLLLLALEVSEDSVALAPRRRQIIDGLALLSSHVGDALQLDAKMKDLAHRLKDSKSILVMGRGYQFATCLEAALKIKELAYIHTEGINTGELKHGPLALIDENLPVIILCPHDHLVERTRAAIQQVSARKGKPIVITTQEEPEIEALADVVVVRVPQTVDCLQSVINVVPLQLLSYHLALARECNVDCPRNLAKSVTVQ
jgi:glutamine---fructose-6-phosphate transaminase (isomerizing)